MTESSDELQSLEQQINELTANIDQLRSDLASGGAIDSEERAAALTNIEELEGSLDALRRRSESVRGETEG